MKDFKQYILSESVDLSQLDAKVKSFVVGAQKIIDDYYKQHNFNVALKPTLRADRGKKYIKLVAVQAGAQLGSAHTFIDTTTGDVLKPASYSAPAKGVRGNVFDSQNGLGRMGPHGPEYNNSR